MFTEMHSDNTQTMDNPPRNWEADISVLLDDLSASQEELLAVLAEKREVLSRRDPGETSDLQQREQVLADKLQTFHDRRSSLLEDAAHAGLPHDSITSLAKSVGNEELGGLEEQVKHSSDQMRLLRHESLTNWVIAQRSLLHVSQMLEIIATGGRLQPTYGSDISSHATGSLVDQEA